MDHKVSTNVYELIFVFIYAQHRPPEVTFAERGLGCHAKTRKREGRERVVWAKTTIDHRHGMLPHCSQRICCVTSTVRQELCHSEKTIKHIITACLGAIAIFIILKLFYITVTGLVVGTASESHAVGGVVTPQNQSYKT